MYDLKSILDLEINYQKNLKQIYLGKLKHLPEGNLSVANIKGKDYYYKYDQGKRTYLGRKKVEEIRALQSSKVLNHCVERIDENLELMERFLEEYQVFKPDEVSETLSRAYHGENLDSYGERNDVYKSWGNQEYQRSTIHPEALVHRTLKGDFVRSKSEVIIANTLFMKKLEYRSEEITKVGEYIFAPDFKILVPSTKKIKTLEHFGMMFDPVYREKALKKMATYIENGYRPYEDILFTFDDLNGNIDAKNLDLLITNFCM